jgi:hypothetical protein
MEGKRGREVTQGREEGGWVPRRDAEERRVEGRGGGAANARTRGQGVRDGQEDAGTGGMGTGANAKDTRPRGSRDAERCTVDVHPRSHPTLTLALAHNPYVEQGGVRRVLVSTTYR